MIGVAAKTQPLSLAVILDDRSYTGGVLQLQDDQTEQSLHDEVLQAARTAGVEQELWSTSIPSPDTRAPSLPTLSSPSTASPSPPLRQSTSIDSHKTWSTGLTSAYSQSRPSVDQPARKATHLSPTQRFLNFSRLTLSTTANSTAANSSRSHSTTTLDTSSNRSSLSFSVPDADRSPRKRSTLKRGLSKLKLRRSYIGEEDRNNRICSRCIQTHEPQRTPTLSLPCNHDICQAHLRKLVVNALISRRNSALSCCNRPFPQETLLEVAKPDEVAIILEETPTPVSEHHDDPFQELRHRAVSPEISDHEGIWTLRNDSSGWTVPEQNTTPHPQQDGTAEMEELATRNAYYALIDPSFRELRNAQLDERDRFLAFRRAQKNSFAQYRQQSHMQYSVTCNFEQNELEQSQAPILSKLEEKHLTLELDLATSQEQEKRNCLLALRHMSAYCQNPADPAHPHTVTNQDRHALKRQCWLRDNMDRRHLSAINVLREQQARQLRQKVVKQEEEMMALIDKQKAGRRELEKALYREEAEMEVVMEERKSRMKERWRLGTEIWKKRRVDMGAIMLPHPIAGVEWPEEETMDGAEGEGEGEVREGSSIGIANANAGKVEVLADSYCNE